MGNQGFWCHSVSIYNRDLPYGNQLWQREIDPLPFVIARGWIQSHPQVDRMNFNMVPIFWFSILQDDYIHINIEI